MTYRTPLNGGDLLAWKAEGPSAAPRRPMSSTSVKTDGWSGPCAFDAFRCVLDVRMKVPR